MGHVNHDYLLQVVIFFLIQDISILRLFLHAVAGDAASVIRSIHTEPYAVDLLDFSILCLVKVHAVLGGNEAAHIVHGPLQERIGCTSVPLGFDVDNELHQFITGRDGTETDVEGNLSFRDTGIFCSFAGNPVGINLGSCIGLIGKRRHRCCFRYTYDIAVPNVGNGTVFEFFHAVFQNPGQYLFTGKQLLRRCIIFGIFTSQIDVVYGVVVHHTTSFTFILS